MPTILPLSPNNHRYGRIQPPPLPLHRMLVSDPGQVTYPPAVDLTGWCGPVKDQGQEGSCTAHAGTSAIEWIFRRYLSKTRQAPVLSPQYLYAWELLRQGSFPQDVGSDGITLSETMIFRGACDLSLYPYTPGRILRPTPVQDYNARTYSMGAYHGVADSHTAVSILGDPTPWPLLIGFMVYESFEQPWEIPGMMPIPKDNERLCGGHEVLGVGYDVGETATLRPYGTPPSILCQNSWGVDWGLQGRFWMPTAILDRQSTDIKIVHAGRPWK